MTTPGIAGLVLAGGRSTRMGGGDKTLLDLGGRPLISHAIERLRPQVDRLAINANGDPLGFQAFGLQVIADATAGFDGPLAGVLAGMDWAAELGCERIATAAGDTPFAPKDWVACLAAAPGVVLASRNGVRHPVFGLWPAALREDLRRFLAKGGRRVTEFADLQRAATVELPLVHIGGKTVDPFLNLNTPGDLAKARALLAAAGVA